MSNATSESEKAASPAISTGLACSMLSILVFFAFLPAIWGEFVSDDQSLIVENPLLRSFSGLWRIWTSADSLDPWPLSYSAFWALRQLFGESAPAFHVANLALHALNACLLGVLLRRLAIPGAWWAAALWAVHPVQVETVAWASEMKNTLCALFALLCVMAYLRFDSSGRRRDYFLALLFFALSLLSKSASVALPAVLLLLSWWKKGKLDRSDWRRGILFWILAAGASLATIWFQTHRSSGGVGELGWSFAERAGNAGYALSTYVAKLLAPWTCSHHVARPELGEKGWLLLVLFATELVGLYMFWRVRYRWGRGVFAAAAIFTVLLLPVLGFVDHYVLRFAPIADRWQYLACAAPIILLAACLMRWTARLPAFGCRAAFAILVLALAGLSFQRSFVFGSESQLWEDTLRKNSRSALAYAGLARLSALHMDFDRSEQQLLEALRLDPGFLLARDYLGSVHQAKGEDAAAEAIWREVISRSPRFAPARENLGELFLSRNQMAEAIVEFEAVLDLQPSNRRVRLKLAEAYRRSGREEEARALLKALRD